MKKIFLIAIFTITSINISLGFEARPFVVSEITKDDIIVSDLQTNVIATRILKNQIQGDIPDIQPGVIAMIACTDDKKITITNASNTQVLLFNTIFEKILTFFVGYDQEFKQKVIDTYKSSPTENFVLKALLSNSLPFVEFQSLSYNMQGNRTDLKQLKDFCFTKPNDLTLLGRDRFFLTTLGRDITQGTKVITRAQRGADENLSMPIPPKPAGEDSCPSGKCDTEEPSQVGHQPANVSTIQKNYLKNFEPIDKPKTVMFSVNNIYRPLEYFPADRIIIHHTAGKYMATKEDGIAYMKGLQQYHAKTLGRGDIGYHFLIDGEGNVYEGRRGGMHTVGAHVLGHNRGSIGISLMSDGYYSPQMLRGLLSLIIFLGEEYHIDPSGMGTFKNTDLSGTETGYVLTAHKDIDKGKPLDPKIPMDMLRKFIKKLQTNETFKNALYVNK